MNKEKDKRYLPDEFKPGYWKGRGPTQIGIGLVIAVIGLFNPNQGMFFVIGGLVWAVFGVCLTVANEVDDGDRAKEQKQTSENSKTKRMENGEKQDAAEKEDSRDDLGEQLKELKRQSRELTDKINELEERNNKGKNNE